VDFYTYGKDSGFNSVVSGPFLVVRFQFLKKNTDDKNLRNIKNRGCLIIKIFQIFKICVQKLLVVEIWNLEL